MVDCAIIGCGKIAGGYDNVTDEKIRTHAKAFLHHSDCNLVAVCDQDINAAEIFAKKWNIKYFSNDFADMLSKCNPDLLSICTPTPTHFDLFKISCEFNIPKIWLEKPADDSKDNIMKMYELSKKSGADVWINYFRRYDKGFKKVKSSLSEIGPLYHARLIYSKGLRHNGSHMIDLIHWFFGKILDFQITRELNDDLYPSICAHVNTEMVAIELIAVDHRDYEIFELDIIGSKGRIIIKDGGQEIEFQKVTSNKYYSGYKNLAVKERHCGSYKKFMLDGLTAGLNGENMPGFKEEIAIQDSLSRFSKYANIVI